MHRPPPIGPLFSRNTVAMAIRILHTADNHIGLPFKKYQEPAHSALVEERLGALARLVESANSRHADFFVVAGDLFDSVRVAARDVKKTAEILKGFSGEAVIVVPGNHDHYTGPETEVWKRFGEALEGVGNVDLLHAPEVRSYDVEGQPVHFFPCPCPSKTGRDPTIGWVADATRRQTPGLRVGIAHGNVTGLGLDAEGQYFTVDPEALEAAGVATWLLGHIHVPFPTVARGERSPYFMAGTHTPDSLRCRHGGTAWWIECEGDRVSRYEQLSTGNLRFVRLVKALTSADDVDSLLADCRKLDGASTLLDLQLSGRLTIAERAALREGITALESGFLHLAEESEIHRQIDDETISEKYPDGGLAARLLAGLLKDTDHPDAAALAHELIEESRNA
jgi:exonuclease SbcD